MTIDELLQQATDALERAQHTHMADCAICPQRASMCRLFTEFRRAWFAISDLRDRVAKGFA